MVGTKDDVFTKKLVQLDGRNKISSFGGIPRSNVNAEQRQVAANAVSQVCKCSFQGLCYLVPTTVCNPQHHERSQRRPKTTVFPVINCFLL